MLLETIDWFDTIPPTPSLFMYVYLKLFFIFVV